MSRSASRSSPSSGCAGSALGSSLLRTAHRVLLRALRELAGTGTVGSLDGAASAAEVDPLLAEGAPTPVAGG